MSDLPQMAGWPADYPEPDPREKVQLIHDDLKELKSNPQLASSPSWLFMFAKNAFDLSETLENLKKTPEFSSSLRELNNWFQKAQLQTLPPFHKILSELKEKNYKDLQTLQKFIHILVEKDKVALETLIRLCDQYLHRKD